MPENEPFKTCGMCGKTWPRWQDLVLDQELTLLGLQVVSHMPEANLLVFDHRCGTTVSVLTSKLRHLVPDERASNALPLLYGTDKCARHCHRLEDLMTCNNACRNAGDRRLTLLVKEIQAQGELPQSLR